MESAETKASPTARSGDPFAVTLLALAGAACGAFLALHLAHHVAFPGTTHQDGVISWLAQPGNAERKSTEIGFYVFTVLLAPVLAWLFTQVGRAQLARDADRGGLLALGAIGILVVALRSVLASSIVSNSIGSTESGTVDAVAPDRNVIGLGALVLATFLIAGFRRQLRATFDRCLHAASGTAAVPAFLGAFLPILVCVLVLGPRTDTERSLFVSCARIAAVGTGIALVLCGTSSLLAARNDVIVARPGGAAPPFSRVEGWRLAWPFSFLLLVRFAPDHAPMLAIAFTACAAGLTFEAVRILRGTSVISKESAWRFLDHVVLPCLIVALVFHRNTDGDIDLFHEGEFLTPAFEVLHGERPFVDVYLQHGLGRNVLRTLATFMWFGATLEVERASMLLSVALTHAAVFLLTLAAFRSRVIALVVALATASAGFDLDWRFLLPLVALGFVARDVHVPRPSNSFFAGACSAAALFVSTDLGLYTTAAISVFILLDIAPLESIGNRVMRLARFVGGWIVGAMPFIAGLWWCGALRGFVDNTREQLALQLSVWGLPFPSFSTAISGAEWLPNGTVATPLQSPTLLALCAAVLYLAIPTYRLVRGVVATATPHVRVFTLLAIAGLLTYRTALGRSDVGHLRFASVYFWILAPGLALIAVRAARSATHLPASLRLCGGWLPAVMLVFYACSAYVPIYTLAFQWIRLSAPPLSRNLHTDYANPPLPGLGDVVIPIEQARALATLDALLTEHLAEDETFYDFSNIGAVYALLHRRAPTRYFMPVYAATAAMQDAVIADLERERPLYAFMSTRLGEPRIDGLFPNERAPRLGAYLEAAYDEPRFVGVGYLARRRPTSGASVSAPAIEGANDR